MNKINTMHTHKLFPYLTLAGAIPFVICTLLLLTNILSIPSIIPILGDYPTMLVLKIYGIIIASFMAGSHWGSHLGLINNNQFDVNKPSTVSEPNIETNNISPWSRYLPIISNLIAVNLWVTFLTLSDSLFLMILISNFLLMLLVDWYLVRANIIQSDYFRIRCYVTTIVVLSLIVAVF